MRRLVGGGAISAPAGRRHFGNHGSRGVGPAAHPHLWLILLAASAVCGVCGLIALGRNLTPFPRPSGATQFVRHGIYARIRHPLYTTVFCVAMGWSLLGPSWPALAVSLVLGIFLDAKARHEERWWRRQFPDYDNHTRQVRRFSPWVY